MEEDGKRNNIFLSCYRTLVRLCCGCLTVEEDDAKLPIPGKRNILIITALPSVNNAPHLGNIIGCALSADVYARYCRLRGYNAIYIGGTDEYGTATETQALEEKCTPKEICDKYHAVHKQVYDWFDISFDNFGRTSTPKHTKVCHGYVSITSCYTSEWEKWWKNPENVELYQFMGKDNVPFHTVMFPSTQLGTKIKGVGVFGNDVIHTNIPVQVWRYYLLANRHEMSDTSFAWGDLQAKLKKDLVNNLGNFVYRLLSFIAKPENAGGYGCVIPDAPGAESHPPTMSMAEKVGELVEEYVAAMEMVNLKQGLRTAMLISKKGNGYLQSNGFWRLYKEDKPACAVVVRTAAGLVHLVAQLLEPCMPSFSREVFKQLNLPLHFSLTDILLQASRPWEILPPSHRICTPQPLFKELKDEEVQHYKEKFTG